MLLVAANVAALGLYVVPQLMRREGGRPALLGLFARHAPTSSPAGSGDGGPNPSTGSPQVDALEARSGLTTATYERVVRIVSLVFLAATGAIVTLSSQWADSVRQIYVLLAAGTLYVVVVQDLLPRTVRGSARALLDAVGAIVFVTLLIALTGGFDSPFFFGYFLVVAGAALVVGGPTTFAVAGITSLVYVLMLVVTAGDEIGAEQLARVAFNLLALGLLSYLGVVVAREQRRSRQEALRLSRFDTLTNLYNRAHLYSALEREIRRAGRSGRRFCVLMLDLDDLKPINDTHGHHYGDRVLRSVSEVIRRSIRLTDMAARYGGDEFVILLPETDPTGAYVLAEKLRLGVLQIGIRVDDRLVRTSVSIGSVTFPDDGTTTDELLMSADAAMYESKRLGKDRIVSYATRSASSAGPADASFSARDTRGGAGQEAAISRREEVPGESIPYADTPVQTRQVRRAEEGSPAEEETRDVRDEDARRARRFPFAKGDDEPGGPRPRGFRVTGEDVPRWPRPRAHGEDPDDRR